MNEHLQEKLDHLSIEIRRQHKRYRSSLRNIIYLSVISLFFFALYSALISYRIREIATPSTVALLIAGQLREQFSADPGCMFFLEARQTAQDMAQSSLISLPLLIPAGGNLLRTALDRTADNTALEISELAAEPLWKHIDKVLSSSETPQYAAQEIIAGIGTKTFDGFAEKQPVLFPGYWSRRLREIRQKEDSAFTRKDACEQELAVSWLYLCVHDRYRDTQYAEPVMDLAFMVMRSWESVLTEENNPQPQKKMKNVPVQKTAPAMQ